MAANNYVTNNILFLLFHVKIVLWILSGFENNFARFHNLFAVFCVLTYLKTEIQLLYFAVL